MRLFAGFGPIQTRWYAGGVREKEIRPLLGPLLMGALVASAPGCKSEPASEPAAATASTSKTASAPADSPDGAGSGPAPAPEPAPDPERADKLADLDAMCKALDHDYVDGTLTDYYRDIQPKTAWGKAQRDAGNESIQPGRLLEKAVAELAPAGAPAGTVDPALPHCQTLLDYLDDVE